MPPICTLVNPLGIGATYQWSDHSTSFAAINCQEFLCYKWSLRVFSPVCWNWMPWSRSGLVPETTDAVSWWEENKSHQEDSTSQLSSPSFDFYILCALSFALFPEPWMGEIWYRWPMYSWAFILILSILTSYESMHSFLNASKRFLWPRLKKDCICGYKHKYQEGNLATKPFSKKSNIKPSAQGLWPP